MHLSSCNMARWAFALTGATLVLPAWAIHVKYDRQDLLSANLLHLPVLPPHPLSLAPSTIPPSGSGVRGPTNDPHRILYRQYDREYKAMDSAHEELERSGLAHANTQMDRAARLRDWQARMHQIYIEKGWQWWGEGVIEEESRLSQQTLSKRLDPHYNHDDPYSRPPSERHKMEYYHQLVEDRLFRSGWIDHFLQSLPLPKGQAGREVDQHGHSRFYGITTDDVSRAINEGASKVAQEVTISMSPEDRERFFRAMERSRKYSRDSMEDRIATMLNKADFYVHWHHHAERQFPQGFVRGLKAEYKRRLQVQLQAADANPRATLEACKKRYPKRPSPVTMEIPVARMVDYVTMDYVLHMRPELATYENGRVFNGYDMAGLPPLPDWAHPSWTPEQESHWRAERQPKDQKRQANQDHGMSTEGLVSQPPTKKHHTSPSVDMMDLSE